MRLEDVTPDWVRERLAALKMTQVQAVEEVARDVRGFSQDKLSKSLGGHRRFTIPERNALARLLCDKEPELSPEAQALARRIEALDEGPRQILLAALEAAVREAAKSLPGPQEGE